MEEWLRLVSRDAVVVIDAMALVIVVDRHRRGLFRRIVGSIFCASAHRRLREVLVRYGRWFVAGLTFQLAADIIGTSIAPSWQEVGQLGAIAVIRTFLNFFLERDLAELGNVTWPRRRSRDTQNIIGLGIGFFGLLVFALLAVAGGIGLRIGAARSRAAASPENESAGVSTVTAAMLGFVAFTLALTTGIAESRFEARRLATRDEANNIGNRVAAHGPRRRRRQADSSLDRGLRPQFASPMSQRRDREEAAAALARTDRCRTRSGSALCGCWQRCRRLWLPHSRPRSTICSAPALRSATRPRAGHQPRHCLGCFSARCWPAARLAIRWGSQDAATWYWVYCCS